MTFDEIRVVGMHYRERDGIPAKSIVANFVPPVTLVLERDLENKYDEYAIKVMYEGQHIGYIEAVNACYIAPHMDDGETFTCTVEALVEDKRNLYPVVTVSNDA